VPIKKTKPTMSVFGDPIPIEPWRPQIFKDLEKAN
jgi:hypothetical protein